MANKQKALEGTIDRAIKDSMVPVTGYRFIGMKDISYTAPHCCRVSAVPFYSWEVELNSGNCFELYIHTSPFDWGMMAAQPGEVNSSSISVPGFESSEIPVESLSQLLVSISMETL